MRVKILLLQYFKSKLKSIKKFAGNWTLVLFKNYKNKFFILANNLLKFIIYKLI